MDDTMQHTPHSMQGNQDAMRTTRDSVTGAIDHAADSLREKADGMNGGRLAGLTDRTANALDATGRYVRDMSARNIMDDLTTMTRDNPGKALLAAAVLGLFVGRSMTRSPA